MAKLLIISLIHWKKKKNVQTILSNTTTSLTSKVVPVFGNYFELLRTRLICNVTDRKL